jgi:hypothetical protein
MPSGRELHDHGWIKSFEEMQDFPESSKRRLYNIERISESQDVQDWALSVRREAIGVRGTVQTVQALPFDFASLRSGQALRSKR